MEDKNQVERQETHELEPDEKLLSLQILGHQIIAPLNALQAIADRLILHYDSWDRERILSQLRTLRSLARWTARMAQNYNWIVRGGSSQLQTSTRWVRLRPLLIRCVTDIAGLAASKGMSVQVDESVDNSWVVSINPVLFIQAVVNLLDNAVKYASDNTPVYISATVNDQNLQIHITSYGIPIEAIDVERIFDQGYRTEAAKAKVVVGTGIGLTIAREIVQAHNGDVIVSPSTFLPKWKAHQVSFTIVLPSSQLRRQE